MDRFEYNQPNTRERIAARRKSRTGRAGSAVRPGPRRALGAWITSGRIASLALAIAALAGLLYIFTAPRFTVQDVRIEGAQAMSNDMVAELAGANGASIWFVDTVQIVERLKTNAYVEDAAAYLTLPDRLTISVRERQPELRWRAGSTLYLVDASGRVLGSDATAPLTGTLVIEDRSARQLQPNDRVDTDALKLSQVLALRLPAELGLTPASIGWDIGSGIFVMTPDQQTIVFGESERLDEKLTVLKTLLTDRTAFTYLDLRPDTPFYRNDTPGASTPP